MSSPPPQRNWSPGTCQIPSCGKTRVPVTLVIPEGPDGRPLREFYWLLVCRECLERRDRGGLALA